MSLKALVFVAAVVAAASAIPSTGLPLYCGVIPPELPPQPSSIANSTFQLKQVITMIRHGDRTAADGGECWANDTAVWNCTLTYTSIPNNQPSKFSTPQPNRLFRTKFVRGEELSAGDCMTGQLTSRGLQQQIGNGKMLASYLVDSGFLPTDFDRSIMFVRSENEDRIIQSAQGLLLGMFPAPPGDGDSSIIDIYTRDDELQDITENPEVCPILTQYQHEYYTSQEAFNHFTNYTLPLYKEITKYVGYTMTPKKFYHFYDCMQTHRCHGFPSPVPEELVPPIEAESNYQEGAEWNYPTYQEYGAAAMGLLVKDVLSYMKPVIDHASDAYKWILISGHDTTLAPFLNAFGAWDGIWPPYASHFLLELYTDTTTQANYIRILKSSLPVQLPTSGCNADGICTWEAFYGLANALAQGAEAVCTDPDE